MKKNVLLYAILSAFAVNSLCGDTQSPSFTNRLLNTIKGYIWQKEIIQEPTPSIIVGILKIEGLIQDFENVLIALKSFDDAPQVDCILLIINSQGGSIPTAEIIADYIQTIKTNKPVIAFISGQGASAAYFIASACSFIIAPETSDVGNIGALSYYSKDAVESVYVGSGKYKHPIFINGKLDTDYAQNVKVSIDELAQLMFERISSYRNIPVETIKEFEGASFTGKKALSLGLIDHAGTVNDVVKGIAAIISAIKKQPYEQMVLIDPDFNVKTTFKV